MPICRECRGTGQIEVKTEIAARCPHCDGTKLLPDGSTCKNCNQWGEMGTGEFNIEQQLCKTCWGSGQVSEGSLTVWYLVRAVPATLVLLGGGGTGIWASWTFLGLTWLTALLTIIIFGLWGGLVYYFAAQLPSIGEISATNWFLIRGIPTTLTSLTIGGAISWTTWYYFQDPAATGILALATFAVWGTLMYFFISHLPE
jgi:hypothetical protein